MVMCEKDGFIPVFEEKDLKEGTMEEISVQEIPILLIKKNGEVFAICDQCPHLGSPLAAGWNGGYIIGCTRSCSGFVYDIRTGKMVDYPDSEMKLTKFDCKIKEGKIWVRLEE